MYRYLVALLLAAAMAVPAVAQSPREAIAQGQLDTLMQAQQVINAAEAAGAATYAKSLLDEAQWRVQSARENWNADKTSKREEARMRADEALWAARAALAKAQWLSTNAAIRSIQSDITKFGGRSELTLQDEAAATEYGRGNTTKSRIAAAQAAVDQAKAAGAERISGNDLKPAQDNINTAKKIASANKSSESADHLAFNAEMMARRALYLARAAESNAYLPNLQLERTRLAQQASEQQAAAERAQREQAERAAADLQRQLAAEQANRQAQAAEVERLRQQIEENRRLIQQRMDEDRAARLQAEQQLDALNARYQALIASGSTADVEALRRQVEDQQIALRAIQERERLNETTLVTEIQTMQRDLDANRSSLTPQQVAERQAAIDARRQQLEALRNDREADIARRGDLDRQQQAAVAEAQRLRQQADLQAQQMKQQVEAAQQAAEQAKQAAQQTQAELDKARQELAQRDAEARRARMEQELSRLANTRSDQRGLIVTLPGIFFDTGKSDLKPGARNTLTRIASQLKSDDTIRISVEGHTDSVGSEETNQTLSERRANAVRDFMVNAGIPADRITASGRGEADPIATNKTNAGRQQNRRVELVITNAASK